MSDRSISDAAGPVVVLTRDYSQSPERPNVWWLAIPETDRIVDYAVATLDRETAEDVAREKTLAGKPHHLWKLERVPPSQT